MDDDPRIPRFRHDCTCCTFLGQDTEADLYFCTTGFSPTVIARFSSKGSDYVSGLFLAHRVPELGVAKKRAALLGLLKDE